MHCVIQHRNVNKIPISMEPLFAQQAHKRVCRPGFARTRRRSLGAPGPDLGLHCLRSLAPRLWRSPNLWFFLVPGLLPGYPVFYYPVPGYWRPFWRRCLHRLQSVKPIALKFDSMQCIGLMLLLHFKRQLNRLMLVLKLIEGSHWKWDSIGMWGYLVLEMLVVLRWCCDMVVRRFGS